MSLEEKLTIALPQQRSIGIIPLIIAVVIAAFDIIFVFLDNIISAAKNKADNGIIENKGVLSATAQSFELSWGMVFSFCLNFVENSLKWELNRPKWNLFGSLNATASTIFLLACGYTWLWANDAAGITFIAKSFLVMINVRTSPDVMRERAYSGPVKYFFDIIVCWFLPIQCAIVLVDSLICMCRKGRREEINIEVKLDERGKIVARLCGI